MGRLRDARVLHPTQGRHCPSARPSLYSITGAALLFRPSSGSHKKAQIRSPCVKVRETSLHCRDSYRHVSPLEVSVLLADEQVGRHVVLALDEDLAALLELVPLAQGVHAPLAHLKKEGL